MIYRFHFEGNTPSKKNQKRIVLNRKTKRPMILSSSDFERWHKEAAWELTLQKSKLAGPFPIPRCSRIMGRLYYADRRRRDTSNTWESIMDLLVDVGILADDSWAITGSTHQFPVLRVGRAGWEIQIETTETELVPRA